MHKGIKYWVTWKSLNLNDAKFKLQLLDNQETTVVQDIVENINGESFFWLVPWTLPDEETLYKIRVQTMDGSVSDTVGPIRIAKGADPAGPSVIKVTNPGTPDARVVGDTLPIKWTSTTTCIPSPWPPLSDRFTIDLLDEAGYIVKTVKYEAGAEAFDSEGPTGILNWHYDWQIDLDGHPRGKFKIRVKDAGPGGVCAPAQSNLFTIEYPSGWVELPQKVIKACIYQIDCGYVYCTYPNWHSLAWSMGYLRFNVPAGAQGPPDHAMVGMSVNHYSNHDAPGGHGDSTWTHDNVVVRSWVILNEDVYWYKKTSRLIQAKLIITRKWKVPDPGITPCLGGVAVLETGPDFPSWVMGLPPSLPGAIPVNTSQGETWEVDLTQQYAALIQQGKPDWGIMLYASRETPAGRPEGKESHIKNAEGYDLTLHLKVEPLP